MTPEAVTQLLSTPAAELGGISLVEANACLAALGHSEVRRLIDVLDQRAAESGLLKRPPTERYLYVQGLLTLPPADQLSAIRASRYLNDAAKARFEQRVSNQTLVVLAPLTFSDLARILYYQALEYLEELGPGATFIPGAPRVLLLGPYKAGDPKIGQFLAPPLGVHRIASFLKLAGIPATVYDLDLYGEGGYFDLIRRQRFDLIGFSMLEPTLPNEIRVMLRTAELSPASFLIAGGQGAAFNGEFLVENTPVDVVVRGLGEFATLDIAMALALESIGPPDLLRIPALYYRGEHDEIKRSRLLSSGISLEDLRLVSLYWDPADTPYQDYWRFIRGLYSDDHLRVMRTAKLTRTVRIYTESHCPMGCDFCSSTNQLGDAVTGGKQLLRLLSAADTDPAYGSTYAKASTIAPSAIRSTD